MTSFFFTHYHSVVIKHGGLFGHPRTTYGDVNGKIIRLNGGFSSKPRSSTRSPWVNVEDAEKPWGFPESDFFPFVVAFCRIYVGGAHVSSGSPVMLVMFQSVEHSRKHFLCSLYQHAGELRIHVNSLEKYPNGRSVLDLSCLVPQRLYIDRLLLLGDCQHV